MKKLVLVFNKIGDWGTIQFEEQNIEEKFILRKEEQDKEEKAVGSFSQKSFYHRSLMGF